MNKKGQVFFLTIMLAITIIILALALAPVLKENSDIARNVTTGDTIGLDCSNSSISTFDKANCMAVDMFNPYFIGFLILLAGGLIASKIYL